MSLEVKPGARFQSAVCDTKVAVVKTTEPAIDLRCGGQAMQAVGTDRHADATPADGLTDGTLMGKRYVNADESVEVLCTKPGDGTLAIGAEALVLKDAKPLPSSD